MSTEKSNSSILEKTLQVGGFLVILGSTWMLHADNKKQIEKMSTLVKKYETQLDVAIAQDPDVHKRYAKNLRKALNDLTPQERQVLLAIYQIDKE
ncbi:hypothetical protein [Colwellia piezophila]|uniref:hypothetical protein n=1 Tax=Colwellia piezophila TaxID=211668 RepID=UPI00037FFD21|nr:hypothetical protein [Colwellia piezophila]